MDKLLKISEVTAITKLSRNAVYKFMRQGLFPKPIKLGTASAWSEQTIQQWIAWKREQANNTTPNAA